MDGTNDAGVLFGVRTATANIVLSRHLSASLSIREAIEEVRRQAPEDATSQNAMRLLEAEMQAPRCHYFALTATSELVDVTPETRIGEIAVPTEVRTPRGLETVKAARVVIQAYAQVGGNRG